MDRACPSLSLHKLACHPSTQKKLLLKLLFHFWPLFS